jgi:hypothetical protein
MSEDAGRREPVELDPTQQPGETFVRWRGERGLGQRGHAHRAAGGVQHLEAPQLEPDVLAR